MTSTIGRGLLAGAVGTTLLNLASYADMALTGREASTAPAETAQRALDRLGVAAPSGGPAHDAVGAVAGIATGLGVGVLAAGARRMGVRLPGPVGAAVVGALAMAATDAPMSALGVSDPRSRSAADWTRDVVPHLAYGVGVRWVLDATEPGRVPVVPVWSTTGWRPWRAAGRLRRCGTPSCRARRGFGAGGAHPDQEPAGRTGRGRALDLRAGCAAADVERHPRAGRWAWVLVLGEMVVDKLPATPSRLDAGPLGGRVAAGAVGGATVAARNGHAGLAVVAAALGVAGSVAGSVLGAAWREIAADKGYAWPAALAEDAASLAVGGIRPGLTRRARPRTVPYAHWAVGETVEQEVRRARNPVHCAPVALAVRCTPIGQKTGGGARPQPRRRRCRWSRR